MMTDRSRLMRLLVAIQSAAANIDVGAGAHLVDAPSTPRPTAPTPPTFAEMMAVVDARGTRRKARR